MSARHSMAALMPHNVQGHIKEDNVTAPTSSEGRFYKLKGLVALIDVCSSQ